MDMDVEMTHEHEHEHEHDGHFGTGTDDGAVDGFSSDFNYGFSGNGNEHREVVNGGLEQQGSYLPGTGSGQSSPFYVSGY